MENTEKEFKKNYLEGKQKPSPHLRRPGRRRRSKDFRSTRTFLRATPVFRQVSPPRSHTREASLFGTCLYPSLLQGIGFKTVIFRSRVPGGDNPLLQNKYNPLCLCAEISFKPMDRMAIPEPRATAFPRVSEVSAFGRPAIAPPEPRPPPPQRPR